eukprot:GDKJ01027958.1.p1 GENE.GDKJ01027958.1~~GDKJ01027958.1.p1  ORF type:complete len:124 (-),score=6.95 GDKJ01027958.1:73-444(-)
MEKKKVVDNTYELAPAFTEHFRPTEARAVISNVLRSKFERGNVAADAHSTKAIADEIKEALRKSKISPRYKIIVQVVIGDQKGQGVRMGTRCFWDGRLDAYATETYSNESLFCIATAYAIYHY